MDNAWWADGGEPVTILATEELRGESVATVAVPSTGLLEKLTAGAAPQRVRFLPKGDDES